MNKALAAFAMVVIALVGGATSATAQTGRYTPPTRIQVTGSAVPCVAAAVPAPQVAFQVTSNETIPPGSLELQFFNGSTAVGGRIQVNATTGTVPHPLVFGWSNASGFWTRDANAPVLSLRAYANVKGEDVESDSTPVVYNVGEQCTASGGPTTTVRTASEGPSAPGGSGQLPRTGSSAPGELARGAALLVIAGLGVVLFARRRRFDVASGSGTATH